MNKIDLKSLFATCFFTEKFLLQNDFMSICIFANGYTIYMIYYMYISEGRLR